MISKEERETKRNLDKLPSLDNKNLTTNVIYPVDDFLKKINENSLEKSKVEEDLTINNTRLDEINSKLHSKDKEELAYLDRVISKLKKKKEILQDAESKLPGQKMSLIHRIARYYNRKKVDVDHSIDNVIFVFSNLVKKRKRFGLFSPEKSIKTVKSEDLYSYRDFIFNGVRDYLSSFGVLFNMYNEIQFQIGRLISIPDSLGDKSEAMDMSVFKLDLQSLKKLKEELYFYYYLLRKKGEKYQDQNQQIKKGFLRWSAAYLLHPLHINPTKLLFSYRFPRPC